MRTVFLCVSSGLKRAFGGEGGSVRGEGYKSASLRGGRGLEGQGGEAPGRAALNLPALSSLQLLEQNKEGGNYNTRLHINGSDAG